MASPSEAPLGFLLSLALVAAITPSSTAGEIPLDEVSAPAVADAVRLYSLDRVLVVYPAGPGEDVERNRASARRRAQFLTSVRGVQAREIADDHVGEKERAEHLVVLGWSNRILGGPDVPRPFARDEKGIRFLGIEHSDPNADLLFFAPSPFRQDRFLFFWSRIDPELDRFQPLPWLGSSWAIFKEFLVLQQGMFAPGSQWPLSRNSLAEADHRPVLAELDAQTASHRSEHYDIQYIPSDEMRADLQSIVAARESAFAKATSLLGPLPADRRIRLRLYADADVKKQRTGVSDPVHSIPQHRELHMTTRFARTPSPHEEIHIFARELLGPCFLTALYEGLSLSEDGFYGGVDLFLQGAIFLDKGVLPSLDELLREDRMRALPEKVAYPASGLLVGWLRATGGLDVLRRAYGLGDGGAEELAKLLDGGATAQSLENSYRAWIAEQARSRQAEISFLKEQATAQERYLVADYAGVAAALDRALRAKPDDPQTLFNLASALLRTGDYERAEKHLRRLLEVRLGPKEAHLSAFAHYQMGRLFDVQGRRNDALAEYRQVLALPDQRDSHRLAREGIEKPATRDDLE